VLLCVFNACTLAVMVTGFGVNIIDNLSLHNVGHCSTPFVSWQPETMPFWRADRDRWSYGGHKIEIVENSICFRLGTTI
jgi:hypothetical protein